MCTTELGRVAKLKDASSTKRNVKIIARQRRLRRLATRAGSATSRRRRAQPVNFPIIADADRKVSELYDMIHPEANDTFTVRSVFIIDPNKKIRADHHLPGEHRPQLRRDPARHRLAAADRQPQVATPVNWKDGDDVVIVPSLQDPAQLALRVSQGLDVVKPYLRVTPQPNR